MADSHPCAHTPETTPLPRWLLAGGLVFLLLLGLGLRLIDLSDQPLDFHPLRQLNSAIVARGMYYQMTPSANPAVRDAAINLWQGEDVYEPRLLERLVALTYKLAGGEQLWIGRLYSVLFWLLGGLALFDLTRRLAGEAGALVALAFFLVLPFAVIASRSLQPDPLMTALIVASVWAQARWSERRGWGWALTAGVLGGLAALIKPWAGLFVGFSALALVAGTLGLRPALRDARVWLMAGLMVLIPAGYYFGVIGGRSPGYFTYWVLGYNNLRLSPAFYVNWITHLRGFIDYTALAASLVGLALLPKRGRAVGIALWGAYALFGLLMPYQIHTHDYYSLPLIAVAAFLLGGLAQAGYERLVRQPCALKALALAVMIAALAYPGWIARSTLVGNDYRSEAAGWQQIAAQLPEGGAIIALTHADGMYLKYYGWRAVGIWPSSDEIALDVARGDSAQDFEARFSSRSSGFDYFLVTRLDDLEKQVDLKRKLETFRLAGGGDGYLLYDLSAGAQ